MKFLSRIFAAIPILPAMGGVLKNRRDPASRVCAPADVAQNVRTRSFPGSIGSSGAQRS